MSTLPASSHHTTCVEIFDDGDDDTGAASRGKDWSGDHLLEPIIMDNMEILHQSEVEAGGNATDGTDDGGEVEMNDVSGTGFRLD